MRFQGIARVVVGLACVGVLVTACGGGSTDATTDETDVPAAETVSYSERDREACETARDASETARETAARDADRDLSTQDGRDLAAGGLFAAAEPMGGATVIAQDPGLKAALQDTTERMRAGARAIADGDGELLPNWPLPGVCEDLLAG